MSTSVRAAVLNRAPGALDLEQLQLDLPGPDEVLVGIVNAGLCHSDLHEIDGTFETETPILLGHEAAGIVEMVGENVHDIAVGDHVVSCLSVFCGQCRFCISGHLSLCIRRHELSHGRSRPRLLNSAGDAVRPTAGLGAFAEAMTVHRNAVVTIPQDIPFATASILGCAVTTGLGAVFRSARVQAGSTVAVIGTGGVGMMAIQGARIAGASQIIAIDVVRSKLDAAIAFGATDVVDASEADPVELVRELSGGGVDYSFETVGRAATAGQAFSMLAPAGVAAVIGMIPDSTPIQIRGSELFMNEKKLQGSFMGSNQFKIDIPRYVQLYRQGRLLLDEMISEQLDLADINSGFDILKAGGAARVVVAMGGNR